MTSPTLKKAETGVERWIFASRWIMAPMYVGLAFAAVLLLISFGEKLISMTFNIGGLTQSDVILGILSLIDMSLAGNLLFMVTLAGYENFVSKIRTEDHEDHPEWKNAVDFTTLKLKLISSIVAISGIHLLKVFMDIGKATEGEIKWMVIIHVTFVVSGVLLALMDRIGSSAKGGKQ